MCVWKNIYLAFKKKKKKNNGFGNSIVLLMNLNVTKRDIKRQNTHNNHKSGANQPQNDQKDM